MAAIEHVHRVPGFAIYTVDNVFGVVIGRPMDLDDVRALKIHSDIVNASRTGYCVHLYYGTGVSIPSPEVREATSELTRDAAHVKLLARVLVVPGTGFWASAMQGIYTATTAVAPGRFPQRFCATNADAAAFLAPHTKSTARDLALAFDEARDATITGRRFAPA